jgi:quinone-modifying oxidoreductase subunit QmoC
VPTSSAIQEGRPDTELSPAEAPRGPEPVLIKPDLQFKKELAEFGHTPRSECIQCATCSTVCSISPEKDAFPRKQMMWTVWGLRDRLIRDPDIWACYYCGE